MEKHYLNKDDYKENFWNHNYRILVSAQGIEFIVNADHEQDALDYVMDYIVSKGWTGLYTDDFAKAEIEEWLCAGNDGYHFTTHNIFIEEI